MARYKREEISQGQFIIVNLKEQLLPNTFEWTLDYLINKIDISVFERNYHNDERGAAAYSPRVLLKIILFCYSRGIVSSRRIERMCKENIIVKALAADMEPDHDTIAGFISGNREAVKEIFREILLNCEELKLISGEMFAIDGCKLSSNASKEWSGKLKDLRKKEAELKKLVTHLLHKHQEIDRDEESKKILSHYRKTLGEDKERWERQIKEVEKKLKRYREFLATAERKEGVSGAEVQTNITDRESAKIKGPHGYIQGYNGIAIADSKSQVVVCATAIGSGAETNSLPPMMDELQTTMRELKPERKRPLWKSLLLGDTGYYSEENLHEAQERKIKVLIPDPQFRQRDRVLKDRKKRTEKKKYTVEDFRYDKEEDKYICPHRKELVYKTRVTLRNNSGKKYQAKRGDCVNCPLLEKCIRVKTGKIHARTLYIVEQKYEDNLCKEMREKIDNPVYRELYSRRMQIIEPVFANITYWKGMNRFTLRTEEKVNIQWQLYTIVHNIGKCIIPLAEKYGNMR